MKIPFVLAFALAVSAGAAVQADVAEKTRISHYKIGGKTPLGLVNSINRKGRKGRDSVTLASIGMKIRYTMILPRDSCRNGKLEVRANFSLKLPKPRHRRALTRKTAGNFDIFYQFLKRHEEEHRRIALQCLNLTRDRANRILARNRSCERFDKVTARLQRLVDDTWRKCESKHDALDRRDGPKVPGMALYRAAKREARLSGRSALPVSTLGLNDRSRQSGRR